jgi:hypothetical protein
MKDCTFHVFPSQKHKKVRRKAFELILGKQDVIIKSGCEYGTMGYFNILNYDFVK